MVNPINSEVLRVVTHIARDKDISQDVLISIVEETIQFISKKTYGSGHNIKVEINKKSGECKLYRVLNVVEDIEDIFSQISLDNALQLNPAIKVGEQIFETLPAIIPSRSTAQIARNFIAEKIAVIERDKQFLEVKDRVGEIITITVLRIEAGNVIGEFGRIEVIIPKDQLIPSEAYKKNDRIKAYVQRVNPEPKGPLMFLSRTDNQMLVKLLEMEVQEIYEGTITIKAVARDPGSRAKIAVFSPDSSIDAVGSCIGVRGNRIKNISNELGGERINVIKWSQDIAGFAINAMSPVQVTKVIIDEPNHLIELIISANQLSIAIGRRGQNVKLVSKLLNWNIDIITEEQESSRRTDEFSSATDLFTKNLGIDEMLAQLLVAEGFISIEQIAHASLDSFANTDKLSSELIWELQQKAMDYVNNQSKIILTKLEELGVEQELLEALDIPLEAFVPLAENGIKNLEDLEELTFSEFNALVPNNNLNEKEFNSIILTNKRRLADLNQ
ncbi:transcription termination factor NusA [Orientia chuto str. Dubai]|uniref:Transcription termination/antitermination protein NusA n=1 Tax=Orientia chuto str. Dubai TaxID=1359168 RepID=A0A0F3MIZ7_9RICK|nr:transcription termination factor NusA [Candidatus Orientia mediorientalis]KJV55720.1 transcription termination factor NusA [Orientia chuto str. Dubai]